MISPIDSSDAIPHARLAALAPLQIKNPLFSRSPHPYLHKTGRGPAHSLLFPLAEGYRESQRGEASSKSRFQEAGLRSQG